jgi:hypothetical protein
MKTHTQCNLQMKSKNQVLETVAWIPSQFAAVGKFLRIRERDGWQVMGAGETLPSEYVLRHERDYRKAFASI